MGNLPSGRRNSRISQNPGPAGGPPPPRIVPVPPGYPGGHAAPPPPPGPANYPPHVPYYPYPPYNNGIGGPIPAPQYFQHNIIQSNGQYMMNLPPAQMYRNPPYAPPPPRALEVAEHQKANTIQNDVNLKKATLRLEKDEENPGYYLVAFSFDATVAGRSVTIFLSLLLLFHCWQLLGQHVCKPFNNFSNCFMTSEIMYELLNLRFSRSEILFQEIKGFFGP